MDIYTVLNLRAHSNNRSQAKRRLWFEALEQRRLLAMMGHNNGVMVTEASVVTHHDIIPRFAANANFIAVQNGDWSNPEVWSTGQVPGADAIIRIPEGLDVDYDVDSQVALDAIEVSGRLDFKTDLNTSLWLNELMVMPGGTLTVGTQQSPIDVNVHAEIVFTDTPGPSGHHFKTGTVASPGIDPEQYGNGLIVFGHLDLHGAEKTPFARAVGDISKGDTTISLESEVSSWNLGDLIVVPETSQTVVRKSPVVLQETETSKIESATGTEVTLASALQYDHFGITENSFGVDRTAHVANLTRNVLIRSENPDGVRGHMMATAHAEVSIVNAEFRSVGRTRAESKLANTLYNEDGSLIIIGENQVARYPIHLHHASNSFLIDGVVVNDGMKWGITVHETNNGLIRNTIVYDVDGAGIVTESGNEVGNRFINNLVMKIDGGHQVTDGRAGAAQTLDLQGKLFIEIGADGSGFWLRASEGTFIGNTVYDAASYGFNFNGYYRTPDSQFALRQLDQFQHNESVSSKGGLWFTWSQGQSQIANYQRQYVSDFLAWHVSHEGVKAYHEANLTFSDVTIVGNPQVSNANEGSNASFDTRATTGMWFGIQNYENHNLQLFNSQIEGVNSGIVVPVESGIEGTTIIGGRLRNYINIAMPTLSDASRVRYQNVEYLPSHVVRLANTMPDQVANVWHADFGVIEPGALSDQAPPGVPSQLPLKTEFRASDGRLTLHGGDGDDDVRVIETDGIVAFEISGVPAFTLPRESLSLIIFWGAGGSDIFVNESDVRLMAFGGDGDDWLVGGSFADALFGEAGNDRIEGMAGDDHLYGGDGNDEILGGEGADKLRGESGNDELWGGLGSDPIIDGGSGDDKLYGEAGDDVLVGGLGDDYANGGIGSDVVAGNEGHDQLFGGLGDDILSGGSGDDWLQGDEGQDKLWGGDGNDSLVYDFLDWVADGGNGVNVFTREAEALA
ncbi:hypothetical protein NZK35_29570 [Stieleria sp. ICT_E10.1]|uniref:G8 domain-containing protein n=1 Tax=Stieleria sedimenti TaxID=2976331 RepID=UPI0021806FBB|nr:G8 domain-containing protein [Stieleria sedimenti]MCS7470823.1 hypothetical protein [Stieleria sedimenti]